MCPFTRVPLSPPPHLCLPQRLVQESVHLWFPLRKSKSPGRGWWTVWKVGTDSGPGWWPSFIFGWSLSDYKAPSRRPDNPDEKRQPENRKNSKMHLEGLVLGPELFFFFFNLAALDLSCSRQDLVVPWPGMEPRPLNGEFEVLTAGPLGKSPNSATFLTSSSIGIHSSTQLQPCTEQGCCEEPKRWWDGLH